MHFAGRVLPSTLNARLALANTSVDTLRARVAARIGEAVADPDAAALLTALAVGLTDRMSADQWRVFNATGTTHLVAISGLHVTMFALLAFTAARFAWRWLPFARRVEREPFAMLLGLGAAGAYALLSGFSVPAQRTWLMLAMFAWARLAARHVGVGRVWSLALDGGVVARSAGAAGRRLLAVVRGGRRHPHGGQRAAAPSRPRLRAARAPCACNAPSCWRSRRSRSRFSAGCRWRGSP